MIQDVLQYLSTHPGVLAAVCLFLFLALIGGWYVVHHHLKLILVTLLCAGGFASGCLVAYRGVQGDMRDLVAIGLFLIVVFPIVYLQALRTTKIASGMVGGPSAADRGHAKRAGV
ncbi:MAG: hypothetical protein C0511_03420 [Hyphomicrobium sp.]|nr:hypothetical protein [Hyphomicrobium sp.]